MRHPRRRRNGYPERCPQSITRYRHAVTVAAHRDRVHHYHQVRSYHISQRKSFVCLSATHTLRFSGILVLQLTAGHVLTSFMRWIPPPSPSHHSFSRLASFSSALSPSNSPHRSRTSRNLSVRRYHWFHRHRFGEFGRTHGCRGGTRSFLPLFQLPHTSLDRLQSANIGLPSAILTAPHRSIKRRLCTGASISAPPPGGLRMDDPYNATLFTLPTLPSPEPGRNGRSMPVVHVPEPSSRDDHAIMVSWVCGTAATRHLRPVPAVGSASSALANLRSA